MLGLRCCTGFSLVVRGCYSLVAVYGLLIVLASPIVGNGPLEHAGSVIAAPRLRSTDWIVVVHGLSCGTWALQHVGSSQTRNWTCVSCIGKWILYHWATSVALKSLNTSITSEMPSSLSQATEFTYTSLPAHPLVPNSFSTQIPEPAL